jgi:hypothetical protein
LSAKTPAKRPAKKQAEDDGIKIKRAYGCPECGNLNFDFDRIDTGDHTFQLFMIKCHYCHNVVGIYDQVAADTLDEIKADLRSNEIPPNAAGHR